VSDHEAVVVEADGGSRGNPGPAGYGAVVLAAASEEVLAERQDAIGVATNNVAEYRGLIAGLDAAADLGARRVTVRMDSNLVVQQMTGRWQIKDAKLRPLATQAAERARRFEAVTYEWVPRERNTRADRLANAAMDAAAGRSGGGRSQAPGIAEQAAPGGWAPRDGEATRLLLVRHGATAHSAEQRFSGRNELPLERAGSAQAAALADFLSDEPPVAAVVASPLRRAVQTAEWITTILKLPLATNPDLVELDFGEWEGLTAREASDRDPAAMASWFGSADAAPPGGESWAALARRVLRARDALLAQHPGKRVVVVSHVTPIKVLVLDALHAPNEGLRRLHLDAGSISAVDYYADGAASLRLFNSVPRPR
jgi:probable phosphoglycerate mutase